MDLNHIPQSTFRPIRDVQDSSTSSQASASSAMCQAKVTVTSPSQVTSPIRSSQKLFKSWRQGSDTWSSSSRQSSRPGSSAQPGSRPPSTHLYCKSGNSSTSDVSVARNFQQLSVSNRRAAFKTQKWSHSFDQSCVTSPVVPKRRQTSLQQKSLDLDSGYLGSPASGLISSHSLSWAESTQIQSPLSPPTLPDTGSLGIETARLELAELICSQETDAYNRNLSLPAFCQTFTNSSSDKYGTCDYLSSFDQSSAMDEADALDEEIKQIVGDANSNNDMGKCPVSQQINSCLKPTPIRSNTLIFSPKILTPSDAGFVHIEQPTSYASPLATPNEDFGCEAMTNANYLSPPQVFISTCSSVSTQPGIYNSIMPTSSRSPAATSYYGTEANLDDSGYLSINQSYARNSVSGQVKHDSGSQDISKTTSYDAFQRSSSIQASNNDLMQLSIQLPREEEAQGIIEDTAALVSPEYCTEDDNEKVMLAVVSTMYQTYDVPRNLASTSRLHIGLGDDKGDGTGDITELNYSTLKQECTKRKSISSDTNSTLNNSNNSVRNLLYSPSMNSVTSEVTSLVGSSTTLHTFSSSDVTSLPGCSTKEVTTLLGCTAKPSIKLEPTPPSETVSYQTVGSESPVFVFKRTAQFSGKVVDLPTPKPFRASHITATTTTAVAITPTPTKSFLSSTADNSTKSKEKMLLECLDPCVSHQSYLYSDLSSPCSPAPCSPPHFTSFHTLSSPCSPHVATHPLPSLCSPHQQNHTFSLPSPTSPADFGLQTNNSSYSYFQFPSTTNTDQFVHPGACSPVVIKNEPWSLHTFDMNLLPSSQPQEQSQPTVFSSSSHYETRTSVSPMNVSPVVSNLNTPRVSLSSVHSEFSSKIRTNHSSLETSPHASPLGFMDHAIGGFGHSIQHTDSLPVASMDTTIHNQQLSEDGYITPPRSGYSSPHHDAYASTQPSISSYDHSLQSYQVSSTSPYLCHQTQAYHHQYESMQPVLDPLTSSNPFTPSGHDSTPLSEKDDPPDTPDSSIKEEPSEEGAEDGTTLCRWTDCNKDCNDLRSLVDHINTAHMDHKKGCEEFPCFWKDCPRRYKPFNAKYKLVTHIRVHTGEKPNHCKHEGCNRKFARLENLKIHVRSHTGEKPFQCKYMCNKKFSNSSDRAKHEQTHKDPRPYKCEVPGCYKKYTDPSSLRKHVKNHSKEEQDQYKVQREHTKEENDQIKIYREHSIREEHQDQYRVYIDRGVKCEQQQLWTQQDGAADQQIILQGLDVDSGSLTATGLDQHGITEPSMQIYRHPDAFQHYRKVVSRQPDSLDSVEGESSLPYDAVPIRLEQTDDMYGLSGDQFNIHHQ